MYCALLADCSDDPRFAIQVTGSDLRIETAEDASHAAGVERANCEAGSCAAVHPRTKGLASQVGHISMLQTS